MVQVAIKNYKKVQALNWNEAEKYSSKIVEIKGFPLDKKSENILDHVCMPTE